MFKKIKEIKDFLFLIATIGVIGTTFLILIMKQYYKTIYPREKNEKKN